MARRLLVPLLLIVTLCGGTAVAAPAQAAPAPPTPAQDPFYRPPDPLPPGAPGEILRQRRVEVFAEPLRVLPAPVRAWQLLYRSTSATGQPNAVSGTLLVPPVPWTEGPRPLVTYAVGTHGIGDQCAPSYRLRTGTENEIALIAQALLKGWAVVLTDYEGLGTPGTHTYTAGRSAGHAMLDAARAAQRLGAAGLSADGPVGVFGYSQGGQAAAFAAELQPGYAPDLRLVGAAPGGVPADLAEVARFNDGGPAFGLVAGAALGLATAYPEVPFEEILNDRGRRLMDRIREACVIELGAAAPFTRLNDLVTLPDPLEHPRWRATLAENRAGGQRPSAPVLLYHAAFDELIPYATGRKLLARYCELGSTVQWKTIPLAEHITGVAVGGPIAMEWLGARFAGEPARNSC
ncbi:lipase family protein [Amycolatopsis aidingensis]|uniref:lipase family protein n=1 Tax=Amycolatopsis aidingensis TaxID=2842453 RepID=UPI001C0DEA78|nr:lipase family protein [Amycolatopsis aidingensis]